MGEIPVSSKAVLKGFFSGNGIRAFNGKKGEFIWIKM